MKLVLDTNVVISGIFWEGVPNKIITNWFNGRFEVFISASILSEYEKVLKRIRSGLQVEEIRQWIELIILRSSMVAPLESLSIIEADPDDNKFLECAHSAEAEYIISGDKHLLNLETYRRIRILSPSQFFEEHKHLFTEGKVPD